MYLRTSYDITFGGRSLKNTMFDHQRLLLKIYRGTHKLLIFQMVLHRRLDRMHVTHVQPALYTPSKEIEQHTDDRPKSIGDSPLLINRMPIFSNAPGIALKSDRETSKQSIVCYFANRLTWLERAITNF